MSIPYRFMPWARRGLARAHQNADAPGAPLALHPKVTIGLTLQAKQDGAVATAVSGNLDLTLYGPGDIIGLDSRLVVRTDPKPNVTNFEPNYLALVDFDPPDFPWLLTPARPNGQRLRPWLVLVVLDRAVVPGLPRLKPGQPLPSVPLTAAQVASELPDLQESWLWAHAQAVSEIEAGNPGALAAELKQRPERNIARLVCPRRLQARHDYVACVVPAFDAGRLRGLGQAVPEAPMKAAWDLAAPADTELPVYFHWEFSTGPVGDIETLARRLRVPDSYRNDTALLTQLREIGIQPVAVDGDHLLFTGTQPDRTVFEGSMVPLTFTPAPASQHPLFATNLQAMLNSGPSLADAGVPKAEMVPTLSPPLYGEHPARQHSVNAATLGSHWLPDLSLQPRYRLAAGWGAEVVRQNQDSFMQDAWQQMGEVLAAERAFSLARLSRDVLKAVEKRHLAKLSDSRLMALLSPARGRIKVGTAQSLFGRLAEVTLPDELFDGALRRLTSARRPTLKRALWRQRDRVLASIPQQVAALVDVFANASKNVASIDPNRFVPDGILGSRSYDQIPLPADPLVLVDLQPYTGLAVRVPAGEIRALQESAVATRQQAIGAQRKIPRMGDIWHQGILTETHLLRFAQLQRTTHQPLQGNLSQLVKSVSRADAEGVLLTVQPDGHVQAEALKIDGRQGTLKAFKATAVSGPRGVVRRAGSRGPAAGRMGVVSTKALQLYGHQAVFNSLPPGVLGGEALVDIQLKGPGSFSAPPVAEAPPSITMTPAIKDQAVLRRYSEAFQDFQQLWADPQTQAGVQVQPVDFALAPAGNLMRARLDPAQTVPSRLASTLTLAEQPVTWIKGQGFVNDFISSRLDLALSERLRYVIPPCFDRVMAYPHLTFPLSRKLETLAPEVFLPGVGVLPDDFIMALKTNPRFVEAVMLGANHEMGRELLWQGFPTDQRGTPFQHFWQRLDGKTDIEPIHQWLSRPLGSQPGSGEKLVLLLRGQLLERFPTLSVYAYPIIAQEKRPGGSSPPPPLGAADPGEMKPPLVQMPIFKGHLGKDITYLGFDIVPADIAQYFFILEEQMTEPRFGFDEPDQDGQNGPSWLDVDWSEVGVEAGQYFGSGHLRQAPPAQGASWANPHAATVANALLQRPFRGFYRGAALQMP